MTTVDDILAHYGIPGMQWGKHKAEGAPRGALSRGATKAKVATDAGADVIKKGEAKLIFLPKEKQYEAGTNTQTRVLGAAAKVNGDPRFSGKDLKGNPALRDAYYKAVETEAVKIYKEELLKVRLDALNEFIRGSTRQNEEGVDIKAPKSRIKHDDGDDEEIILTLLYTKGGLGEITDVKVDDSSLAHLELVQEDFLAHYGIKGQKWGVRRKDPSGSAPTSVDVQTKPGKGVAKTTGGTNHPVHEDAKKAAVSKQVAKKSSTDALSNQELQQLVSRMNLEQQYTRLKAGDPRADRVSKFLSKLLGAEGDKNVKMNGADEAAATAIKEALNKKAA